MRPRPKRKIRPPPRTSERVIFPAAHEGTVDIGLVPKNWHVSDWLEFYGGLLTSIEVNPRVDFTEAASPDLELDAIFILDSNVQSLYLKPGKC